MAKIAPTPFRECESSRVIDTCRPSRSMRTSVVVLPPSNRFGLVLDAQLFEDAGHHVIHGRFTDSSLFRDCFIWKSLRHVFHHPVFACLERPTTNPSMARTFLARFSFRSLEFRSWDAARQHAQALHGCRRLR